MTPGGANLFSGTQAYHFSAVHGSAAIAVVCPRSHQETALGEKRPTVVGRIQFALRVGQSRLNHVLFEISGFTGECSQHRPAAVSRHHAGIAHILEHLAQRRCADHAASFTAGKHVV